MKSLLTYLMTAAMLGPAALALGCAAEASSPGAGGTAGSAGAAGDSGAAGGDGGFSGEMFTDAGPPDLVCTRPAQLAYDTPGCGRSVAPKCLSSSDPCASLACSCKGELISGGCGYLYEPFSKGGFCGDAGPF
jgi:hypothetical protein